MNHYKVAMDILSSLEWADSGLCDAYNQFSALESEDRKQVLMSKNIADWLDDLIQRAKSFQKEIFKEEKMEFLDKKVQFHLLPPEEMEELGFKFVEGSRCWHKGEFIDRHSLVTADIGVDENGQIDPENCEIAVRDEWDNEPIGWQNLLKLPNPPQFAFDIRDHVENFMKKLQKQGIVSLCEKEETK